MTNKDKVKQNIMLKHYNTSVSLPMWLIMVINTECQEGDKSEFIRTKILDSMGYSYLSDLSDNELNVEVAKIMNELNNNNSST